MLAGENSTQSYAGRITRKKLEQRRYTRRRARLTNLVYGRATGVSARTRVRPCAREMTSMCDRTPGNSSHGALEDPEHVGASECACAACSLLERANRWRDTGCRRQTGGDWHFAIERTRR